VNKTFANDPFRWDEESSATEVPPEMVQTPLALTQPTAPPSSPNLSPSKCFITLSDGQDLATAVVEMHIASAHDGKYTCSHTPPEDLSETTPTEPRSPTPGLVFPANQPSAQIVITEYAQRFLDILKSLSSPQGPPPPSAKPAREPGEGKARTSRLEFKTINEVYVSNAVQIQAY
jgi:hypothetical protein